MIGLAYNPLTGIFTRDGTVAGTVNAQGYVQIKIDGSAYLAQRLAWWTVTGKWPENDIDHKNRNKQDNRFVNLRDATDPENQRNRGKQKNNKSGFKGVSWDTGRKAWVAMIHDGTKNKNLGYFASRENAAIAYDVAALKYHGEFAHLNFGDDKMDIRITHVIELSPALMTVLMSSVSGAALSVPQPDKPSPQPAAAPAEPQPDALAAAGETGAADGAVDAAGWPWDASLHAATRGQTKDGLWRMKVGVSRPDPKPGFPKENGGTGTASNGAASPASGTAASGTAGPATDGDDEDEFAAFRAAADKSNATDAAAAAAVPARKWSDADLGALCNQAAVKLGDPVPVKTIIGQFVPEGTVPHSRNIPDDQREAFAKAVEAKAGIEFAG